MSLDRAPAAEPDRRRHAAAPPAAGTRRLLGDMLVARGIIDYPQLEEALAEQRLNGGRLGEILVTQGRLTLAELMAMVSEQHGLAPETPESLRDRLGSLRRSA